MINTGARVATRPFYAAGIHGFYGYIFADLFAHEFVVERDRSNVATALAPETLTRSVLSVTPQRDDATGKTTEIVKKQEIYCPLILANSSPLAPDVLANRRKLRAVPPLLPCLRALFDFQRAHSRLPNSHTGQDIGAFTALATTQARELQLPPETLRADFLRKFIQNIGAEVTPTAAFVGGRLSEDVINVVGKREQPIQNFALFDGDALEGRVYCLYSPPPELAMGLNGLGGMEGMGGLAGGDLNMGMGMGMPMDDGLGGMQQVMPMGDGSDGMMPVLGMENGVGAASQSLGMDATGVAAAAPTSVPAGMEGGAAPMNEQDAAATTSAQTGESDAASAEQGS